MLSLIQSAADTYNNLIRNKTFRLSVFLGHCTKEKVEEDFRVIRKTADDQMIQRKLLEQKSSYSAFLSSVNATMFEKSFETKEHAERLASLSRLIGEKINLSQVQMDSLELSAILHDTGKVGIDDRMLKKPGKLPEAE